jgi:hypothetical protein
MIMVILSCLSGYGNGYDSRFGYVRSLVLAGSILQIEPLIKKPLFSGRVHTAIQCPLTIWFNQDD